MLDDLAWTHKDLQGILVHMSIHATIKREREARGWSMETLAKKIAELEGSDRPLAWQTIQQWEKEGGTAPKRKRMDAVAKLFGMSVPQLLGLEGAETSHAGLAQEARPSYNATPLPLRPKLGVVDIVLQLGAAMENCDEAVRRAIAALIHDMVIRPESAQLTSQRVAALIGVEGNAPLPRSSNSR